MPADGLAALVVNGARARRLAGVPGRFAAMAAARGLAPLILPTAPDDPGDGVTRTALAAGAGVVFAAGGDGTVRACAQALAGSVCRWRSCPPGRRT